MPATAEPVILKDFETTIMAPGQHSALSLGEKASQTSTLHGEALKASEEHKGEEEVVKLADQRDDYPDGGLRAWLVVFGAVCTTFSTFGFVNSFGVFQTYYESNILQDSSPSNIAWIGSIQYSLVFLPAVIVGRMFDLGWFHLPFAIGSIGLVASSFIIAQCSKYWHFILAQGLLVGICCGTLFGPVVPIVGHWFKEKRGLALSFIAFGSSIGGTIIPIAARLLITKVGFPWTMRIIGFILLGVLSIANMTLKRRIPPKNIRGGLFNFNSLRNPAFAVYCCSAFSAYLGMYTLLTFIGVSAESVGVPQDFSFYLVAIANAGSGFGRILTAFVVDKTGCVNFTAPMSTAAALITYLWPLAHTKSAYIAIAVTYGFTSAAYLATFQMPAYNLGAIEDVGRRAGLLMTFAALGAIAGPPISGAINHATGGFAGVGYYAGSIVLMSTIFSLITRHLVLRRLWGKF